MHKFPPNMPHTVQSAMDASDWDDSALIHAFDSAMSKYQEMHRSPKRREESQEDVRSEPSLLDKGLAGPKQPKSERVEGESREEEGNPHIFDLKHRAAVEDTGQEQQSAPGLHCCYNSAGVDGPSNMPGCGRHYALQQIYHQLQQLELQQQVLRQQVETWTGLAGWNGVQRHSNYGNPCQAQDVYPSSCLPLPMSPQLYPCYCHYQYRAQSSWNCEARCRCLPACVLHAQPRRCQFCWYPTSCSQDQLQCQAQLQYAPAYRHSCQHVSRASQDAGIGTVDGGQ